MAHIRIIPRYDRDARRDHHSQDMNHTRHRDVAARLTIKGSTTETHEVIRTALAIAMLQPNNKRDHRAGKEITKREIVMRKEALPAMKAHPEDQQDQRVSELPLPPPLPRHPACTEDDQRRVMETSPLALWIALVNAQRLHQHHCCGHHSTPLRIELLSCSFPPNSLHY